MHERKERMTMTTTTTYRDVPQQEAVAALKLETVAIRKLARSVRDADAKSADNGLAIGRRLNTIANNGLAVAAAHSLDGGNRDWTDGRETEVSAYLKVALSNADGTPIVARQRASDWRKIARNLDAIVADGIDISKVPTSPLKNLKSDASTEDVVAAVRTMVEEANGEKVTVDEFKSAARTADVMHSPNASGPIVTVDTDPFASAISAAVKAVVDAPKLSASQRKQVEGMVATILEVLKK